MNKLIQIKQIKSSIGYKRKAKATLIALGLRKINQVVEHKNSDQIRGMIRSIPYLLEVKEL
tara:strand:+ start:11 stop:193 length:183 start_codon:yes stop_codon:yes gene_type:complete